MGPSESNELSCERISRGDSRLPGGLEALSDPPDALFVSGEIPAGPMVAVVGARDVEPWAERFSADLASDLVARGYVVVSGGALGVDTAAHRGALDGGGRTVAVLGSGLGDPYPASNEGLFERIRGAGALVSEFTPNTPPARWTFPRRNRLVAAMASAVVVVQAARRSGALITARMAGELGVPVGAVPGLPASPRMVGCNGLIREGAALVEGVDDVLRMMGRGRAPEQLNLPEMKSRGKETPSKAPVPAGLCDREARVYASLESAPVHIDDLAASLVMPVAEVGAALLSLELSGFVEDVGQKHFVKR